jgi:formylglycine-generating enzyme required for sulfatase activity
MCLDDAAETSAVPFEELLRTAPGKSKQFWARQLVALRVLEQLNPEAVEALQSKLTRHPSADIRQWIRERATRAAQDVITAERGGYELVRIPGGEFMMGSQQSEEGRFEWEGPMHKVQVPHFYLGRYPLTNEEYGRFMKENSDMLEPKYWADRRFNQPRQPVVGVSWEDAERYAEWAGLRLPSEAEWEYACRADTSTRFYTGDKDKDLERAGWYNKNSGGQPHPVGQKEPNSFSLYDMHVNVWEWVEDDWHDDYVDAPDDGSAWIDEPRGAYRMFRGGSWRGSAQGCRSALRRGGDVGFRLARSVALGPLAMGISAKGVGLKNSQSDGGEIPFPGAFDDVDHFEQRTRRSYAHRRVMVASKIPASVYPGVGRIRSSVRQQKVSGVLPGPHPNF